MSSPGLAMALKSPGRFRPSNAPLSSHAQRRLGATHGRRGSLGAGPAIVAQASSGRTGAVNSPQRSFSVMQSAMKIPGLASALHLIGVNGPGSSAASGESTVAAAGSGARNGLPAPEDSTTPSTTQNSEPLGQATDGGSAVPEGGGAAAAAAPEPPRAAAAPPAAAEAAADAADAAAAAAEVVYELAAVAASSNGNGYVPAPQQPPQQPRAAQAAAAATAASGGARQFKGYANGVSHLRGGGGGGGGSTDPDDPPLSVMDPGSWAGNNIAPYTVGGSSLPSLAVQIREIASTLRHINSLRLDYLDKISQQELELAAKDQVLRSKEERIQSLEQEAAELRRSMAMLHTAKAAAEIEVQRLRTEAAAAAAAAPAPALSAAAAPPLPPPLPPTPTPTTETAPAPAAAAAPAVLTPPAAAPAAPPPPHPLTTPPAAMAASAPATVAAHPPAPAPPPAPTPASPPAAPPPPPPRIPEIMLFYRSSWPEAFLHVNVEGRGWTAVPGLRMEHAGSKEYSLRVQGRSIEFVLTNGQGEWDSPGGGPGRNYRIDTPGEYRLHYGALTQVKPWQP
ncbi:hypothetical protein PLESTB_000002500 [Pleodorina starrii]|uniref:Carbohydrate binding module family 25 domain-containing protein n=1 Tax=Pleodorina starrii TaxID=330485 RepID=A0A9W6B9S3_9CHLO|nr:hypothetical protein PLESTM_000351000 [Pleodorina starrii]GLC47571.1 hypothetical protein PLESTB_000002500 [Pleodorina starrii]GLC76856.1 hypothetical protein PLESTF_001848500 [Pleodorina starrii]